MSNELPPLPGDVTEFDENGPVHMRRVFNFTRDQMREYGRACERAAYERAANRAMQFAKVLKEVAAHNACVLLADSIRALGDDK